ncbi:MAG: U32 family peptidase [Proteobacteria bacterium]|nr:U32 family peptidase [Pseudomonadota bacterium]
MHIVAPISRVPEVELLAAAGAKEFYCGILPQEWVGTFRTSNANRRIFGNLTTYDDLEHVTRLAHDCQCFMSLVLNGQQYTQEQIVLLVDVARRFRDGGGDSLIVSDIGLILALSEALPGFRIHVSSVASCRNGEAARFYRELGARRVILPRDITLAEAARLVKDSPEIEFEVFVLNDGCVFEEGVCHTIHLPGKLGGPICLDKYSSEYYRLDGRELAVDETNRLAANEADYQKWLWYRFSNGFSVTPEGLPYGPCGLCAISALHAAGIKAIKIAGREGATERKVASVKMVKQVLDRVTAGSPRSEVAEFARGLRPSPEHCKTGYMCYYPEVILD